MCVHGYPADKSIFCLQLESRVTEITKRCDTSHADTYEDDVSVACAARCSWSRSMFRVRRFWAIIHVF